MLPALFTAFPAFTSVKSHSPGAGAATDWSKQRAKSVAFLAEKGTELELCSSHWPLREAVNSWRTDKKQSKEFYSDILRWRNWPLMGIQSRERFLGVAMISVQDPSG